MPSTMRERFRPFRRKNKAEFTTIWSTAEFTFDANVLLDLYSSPRIVLDEFGRYLTALGDRFYLTDQTALEFYRNRERVVIQARNTLGALDQALASVPVAFSDSAQEKLKKLLSAEREALDSFLAADPVEDLINEAVGERLDPPSEDLTKLYPEIDARYSAQIPPGFADAEEKDNYKKYGDAVLWLQVIDHQKRSSKPLILVTSDSKRDWWTKDNKNVVLGPRPELAHEMWEKAGVQFHLYSFTQFIKFAAVHFPAKASGKKVEAEAVKVAEQIGQQRDAASQAQSEISGKPDLYPTTPYLSETGTLPVDLPSFNRWASPNFQYNMLTFQDKLNALQGSTLASSLPGPNTLHAYANQLDAVRRLTAQPINSFRDYYYPGQSLSSDAVAAYNRVNDLYKPSSSLYEMYRNYTSAGQQSEEKKPTFKKRTAQKKSVRLVKSDGSSKK